MDKSWIYSYKSLGPTETKATKTKIKDTIWYFEEKEANKKWKIPIKIGDCQGNILLVTEETTTGNLFSVLPSWTAWKGLLPSTNVTEHVIFSVCKISSFWLRSATAIRKTSSSFLADSSKIAPVEERKNKNKNHIAPFISSIPKH